MSPFPIARALVFGFLLAAWLAPAAADAATKKAPAPYRPPYAEIVIDFATDQVLHAENPDQMTQPASLAKLMTLYLVFEALDRGELRIDQWLPVSRNAANASPSKLGLRAGETVEVEDAILGLVTRSANDAAVVLAEALAGSVQSFAERMTAKARELGMPKTVFRNASGLPNREQKTTAREMATLARAMIEKHPARYFYFSYEEFPYNGQVIRTHNKLLSRYPGMDGLKTGFVNASGFNLAASAVRDGRRLLVVVLGGTTAKERDKRVAELFDRHFGKSTASVSQPAAGAAGIKDPG